MQTALNIDFDALISRLSIKPEPTPAEKFFRGIMPGRMPGCEIREQQIQLALAVEQSLEDRRHIIGEAGTGTGKSYSYLAPVIRHTHEHGVRAVVSTGTIALQEQLISKDIPFLQKLFDFDFTARLAKGKGNYLCLVKLGEELNQGVLWQDEQMEAIARWAKETGTGDRAELAAEPGDVWGKICADDSCTGKKCPRYGDCFYQIARARLAGADIIVCNHALFFTDLAVRKNSDGFASLLPEYQVAVFDEAHHVESVARGTMSTQVSSLRLPVILAQLKKRPGCDLMAVQDATVFNDIFFRTVAGSGQGDKFVLPRENKAIANAAEDLQKAVRGVVNSFDHSYIGEREEALFARLDDFNFDLLKIVHGYDSEKVFWTEKINQSNGRRRVTLHATPIDMAPILSETLFKNPNIKTVVMTSATIAAGNSFGYLKKSVGCAGAIELQMDSPFDYPNQCLLYLPPNLPDPKAPDFHEKIAPHIENILLKTSGRAFVLFTSYRGMNEVYDRLAGRLRWTVLKQGDMPRQRILDAFRKDVHSVLFATASFWEGVDVQGEALSCVIITKLPFAVPDEPVTEAKVRAIERAGGKAFFDYSLPEAIIKLKQGFGRLIRTRGDRGIVAILDPRVKSKGYGRQFINSLPRCREVISLDNVDLFLKRGGV